MKKMTSGTSIFHEEGPPVLMGYIVTGLCQLRKKMKTTFGLNLFGCIVSLIMLVGCNSQELISPDELNTNQDKQKSWLTKNVVIVVIDGPRFSETWGDPTRQYIPNMGGTLANQGVQYNWFYNDGPTYTTSGHTALTTGKYQIMQNDGSEFPQNPSIFQYWLNHTKFSPHKALIATSKEKLRILADCSDLEWRGKYNPIFDAENREDKETFETSIAYLKKHQPNLALIHFKGPDHHGHNNDWIGYLNSITETDQYVNDLWNYLQKDPNYQNITTLFVTNDHGRHLDNVRDGFKSHGDYCEGCLHINLLAIGPDFKSGISINQQRETIDIAPTISELMGFKFPTTKGEILYELFK